LPGSSAFWSVVLIGGGALSAWQLGWLPLDVGETESGALQSDDGSDPADTGVSIADDPIVFTEQTEPGDVGFADRTEWSTPTTDSAPRLLPFEEDTTDRPLREIPPNAPPNFSSSAPQRPVSQTEFNERDRAETSGIITTAGERERIKTNPKTPASLSPKRGVALSFPQIDALIRQRDYVAAHRELSAIYWDHPASRNEIKKRIETTANSIYFSPQPHYMKPYTIQPGDQLRLISKKYSVPWQYLVRLNQVDPRKIRAGQDLKVIKGPFSAHIELSKFEMTIHNQGYFVRRYTVGIGKDGQTPIGRFRVMTRLVNPKYFGTDGIVIEADDPANPLGERWIDIGKGYGIHGTINPKSIGKAQSRGCVRMHNADVEEVFDLLGEGSEVVIRP
jgi:lipoprotein-anchoring transpeptidase ErfK/SrfK